MTDEELQEAINDANSDVNCLSLFPPAGPLPDPEIRRREMILLRQLTLYKIEDARKQNKKDVELFNTVIYGLMTSFVKSHQ
ncbi:MAG: hypothetical protein GH158_01380 [Dehalococcoidia bacterium]|nr:hypothetical protein [Dehalococcoidia bacterium]